MTGNFCLNLCCFHCQCSTVGIRPYQTAAAQQNAAKITGDHTTDIGEILFLQDIQDGNASRSLRLAVIGITGHMVFPQDISINIVSGFAVRLANFFNTGNGSVCCLYRH